MKDSEIASQPTGTVLRALKAAAPQTVPVFAGYLVLGIGYGIYVQSLGLPVWMPMLMGTVVYGGDHRAPQVEAPDPRLHCGGTVCYVLLVQLVF